MLLVLCRHGQSEWNLKNLFTGWTDVDLSEKGVEEAREAGKALKANGFSFDVAYSSVLKRANRTMDLILEELGEENIEKHYSWRLNERHYGALQGLNKADSAKKWGDEQVHVWRRSANVPPPALTKDDPRFPAHGNSLRALVMELEHLTAEEIVSVEIPTGKPLVYELDDKTLAVKKKYYL